MKGINTEKGDPNYDLFKQAIKTTSKRLFPNFVNTNAPFNVNKTSDDLRDTIATMGCRTRVFGDNTCSLDTPVGRGNLSFTTLNLPMIAMKTMYECPIGKMKDTFYKNLDEYIDICIEQLKDRYEYQKTRKAGNFRFMYENGVWKGTDEIDLNEPIGEALKTGTLSVGFIGLAEALMIMTGYHHGEDANSWEFGYEIVKHIRERMDKQIEIDGLNWSCLATPSEGLAGKSLRKFVAKYGVIENVSDREYLTNSFHIPVYYNIKAIDKIKLEAPFHELTNAGHICYVELDGDVSKNEKAVEKVVKAMLKHNIGYGSINHARDTCRDCGEQGVFDGYNCPECGSHNVQKVARITGYLVGDINRWNNGKRAELRDRVKHGIKSKK